MKLSTFKNKLLRKQEFRKEYSKHDLAFEISQMLLEARIIKGITQAQLAELINTKQTSIARAESGKHLPSLSYLQKIAEALHSYVVCPKFGFMNEKDVNLSIDARLTEHKDENVIEEEHIYRAPINYSVKSNSDERSFAWHYAS